ncbi:hypothetical protein [Lewinella sp. W8]|uniref:hypothetical protein n=1 Tax=Lewinella sp. W8 TaxID=2528208 RepID=UPI0010680C93|nr:hypothetical protein [Lewinella sp. W8]MTB52193.1 hypothetical protein [Lewinella sp. W8]
MKSFPFKSLFLLSVPFIALLTLSSCIDGFIGDVQSMNSLHDSLQLAFPEEKIGVKISNGTHIRVSFTNSERSESSKSDKDQTAIRVGEITQHFFPSDKWKEGQLTFVTDKNYGVVQYTEEKSVHPLWPVR